MYTSHAAAVAAAALVLHSGSPLRKNEIARATGLSWPNVQRATASLNSLGLLRVASAKGYETYEIDPATPYLPAVRRAALVDGGIVEAIEPMASRIRFVLVIGSFAWGAPTSDSDVDLLVVGGVTHQELNEALAPLSERYERAFDIIAYTDEEMRARLDANDYLLINAITNGVRVMGDPALVPAL